MLFGKKKNRKVKPPGESGRECGKIYAALN